MCRHTSEDKVTDGILLAIQFLTRIPVKKVIEYNNKNLRIAISAFPLIGLIIGLISGLLFRILVVYDDQVAAGVCILAMVILSGGLHLDGLSDTLDGFLSGREKERTMEIMKDSRLGTFGALGLILVILLKFVFLSVLGIDGWIGIPVAMAGGRLSAAWMIWRFPPARKEGLGSMFKGSQPDRSIILTSLLFLILIGSLGLPGMIALTAAVISGQLVGKWSMKKINGLTGDVYGAGIELSELVVLAIFGGVNLWI